jgi:NADPH-dependent 2,4-dienoyl-CoA reductase/sulfur reductase-like enzyme
MRRRVTGGSDPGISAALRARELDPSVEVTVVVADRFPNLSICGLPYHVSGDVPDWWSAPRCGQPVSRARRERASASPPTTTPASATSAARAPMSRPGVRV